MSGNNGEKNPLPEFKEEYKDAFLHVALKIIEQLSGNQSMICIKPEALDTFPENEKPLFIWNKAKGHWMVINPKAEKKIATPSKRLILPNES